MPVEKTTKYDYLTQLTEQSKNHTKELLPVFSVSKPRLNISKSQQFKSPNYRE